jgi:hypothetical protein
MDAGIGRKRPIPHPFSIAGDADLRMKTLTADSSLPRTARISLGILGLWHLVSFDAPTVAAVWTVFVARVVHVDLPWAVPAAMFVAVWAIYAADRLLDAGRRQNLEARHRFHGRYRAPFRAALAVAAAVLAPLILALPAAMLRCYAALGALLILWLGVIHLIPRLSRAASRRPIPKELAVGAFFSAAICIPAAAAAPSASLLAGALAIANLCSLNCLFIYSWEHPAEHPARGGDAHATTRFGLRRLREIALGSIVLPLLLPAIFPQAAPTLVAASLAAALLLLLDRSRPRFGRTTLRAAADAALLTPLLLLPFLR